MKAQTRMMAYKLIAAVEMDPETKADLASYGDWVQHLTDQLNDNDEDN